MKELLKALHVHLQSKSKKKFRFEGKYYSPHILAAMLEDGGKTFVCTSLSNSRGFPLRKMLRTSMKQDGLLMYSSKSVGVMVAEDGYVRVVRGVEGDVVDVHFDRHTCRFLYDKGQLVRDEAGVWEHLCENQESPRTSFTRAKYLVKINIDKNGFVRGRFIPV